MPSWRGTSFSRRGSRAFSRVKIPPKCCLCWIFLLVREEDAAHAERILQDYLETEASTAQEDPDPAEEE